MAFSVDPQPWVTFDDVSAGYTVPSALVDLTQALVDRYAGELESLANRPLSVVVTDELTEILPDGLIPTRHRPVASVEAIAIGVTWEPDVDVSSGNIRVPDYTPSSMTTGGATSVIVSYTAAQPPHVLTGAVGCVVERIRRRLAKEESDAIGTESSSEEGHAESYTPEGWTEAEKSLIESIRRRVGA